MNENKKPLGLGRGLSALMEELGPASARHEMSSGEAGVRPTVLAVTRIRPNPMQPRRRFDEAAMLELVESIRERGVLQPILVRPVGDFYEIVAGERRWRAAQAAQLHDVPVVIRTLDDAAAFEIALIENIQRADLNPIEEAEGYRRLIDDFNHTQDAISKLVGKSRSHVANLLRLLDLPGEVRALVIDGSLSMGHARALLTAEDPVALADKVIEQGLSVRQVEAAVQAAARPKLSPAKAAAIDPDIRALELQLGEAVGMTVTVDASGGTQGNVSIRYSNLDQLDRLCRILLGDSGF